MMPLDDVIVPEHPEDDLSDAIWDETPVLRPGTDWHGDVLYMTFPVDRNEEIEVGKGKNKHTENRRMTRTMVLTSTRRGFWYTPENVAKEGFRWPPAGFLQETETRWPIREMEAFKKGKELTVSGPQLYLDLVGVYTDYVEYTQDIFYDLIPYYIMGSYLYRLFPTIGYLHFNGTAASGKSQNLKLLKVLSFNCVWASNLSTASLYRQVDGCPGLICIDEAESFEGERGEELRRLLNAGYKDGEPVMRAEATGDGTFAVRKFDVYSPKALASINPLEPVIQSRCVVIPMQPASIKEIKEFRESDPKWPAFRNRLYHWAMQNAPIIGDVYQQWNEKLRFKHAKQLTNRTWEITQVFIVLAHALNGLDEAERLVEFFAGYFAEQQKAAEEVDRQRLLLKCLPEVLRDKDAHNGGYLLKDIHDVVEMYLDEDSREYYRTKQVSKHLTALGFKGRAKIKGGTTVPLLEEEIRSQFKKRNVTPFPADEAWFKGEISYEGLSRSNAAQPASASLWGTAADDEPAAAEPG